MYPTFDDKREVRVMCSYCSKLSFKLNKESLKKYFFNEPDVCECGRPFDWWNEIEARIAATFETYTYSLVGVEFLTHPMTAKPGSTQVVNTSDLGLPDTARILGFEIYSTAMGQGARIQELRRQGKNKILFSIVPEVKRAMKHEHLMVASVSYVMLKKDDYVTASFIQALETYVEERYIEGAIPANIAIEIRAPQVIGPILERFANYSPINEFDTSAPVSNMLSQHVVTHASLLKVMLPIAAHLAGFPAMPERVKRHLIELNAHRNSLAHTGVQSEKKGARKIDRKFATDFLVATFMGLQYLMFLEEHAKEKLKDV